MNNSGDLVRRWQRGWALARGFAPAEEARGGLHVPVGDKGRRVEVVVLEPGAVAALAADLADDHWLTVPTTDPDGVLRIFDDTGLTVLRTESLMSRDLRDHPANKPPAGYTITTSAADGVITTRIGCDGEEAATGMMPVIGTDAVAHNIVTSPRHRRRGLASAVMSALVDEAAAHGATTGILVASPDGEGLYTALGWQRHATVLVGKR